MSLIEVMAGLVVLGLTVVAASAMFPMSALLRDRSGGYSKAAAVVQRKIEQIRKLPTAQLSYNGMRTAGIVDSVSTVPTGSTQEYHYQVTDELSGVLPNAHGHVILMNPGTDLVTVQVDLSWRSIRGRTETVRARTFVSDKTVWREP
jgi:hypothetical protein